MANQINRLEPAATVIEMLGGVSAVARQLGIDRQHVHRWMVPKPPGSGGHIPSWHLPTLLDYAEQNNIPLTAEMLIRVPKSRSKRGR